MSRNAAERLADFACGLKTGDLPGEACHEAKRCILDTFGDILAGRNAGLPKALRDHASRAFALGPSSLLGSEKKLQPVGAALVNSVAGHIYDFDDTSYSGIMHGSVVALPAALAAVEAVEGDGRLLIEAFVAAVESEYAVAQAFGHGIYFKGWWTTGLYGAIGATIAGAKSLGLERERTAHAIALAAAGTTGMRASFGSDAKPLGAGQATQRGLDSAYLAKAGIEGPLDIFEDSRGLSGLMNNGHWDGARLDDLGQTWRLLDPGILFKRYPVCSAAQAAAEAVERLLAENQLTATDIRQVLCEVPELVRLSLVHDNPGSAREAQFSMPFAVGAILAYGRLGLEQIDDDCLANPNLRREMAKVEMRVIERAPDPDLAPEDWPEGAKVTLMTTKGESFSLFLPRPTGMPGNPVTDAGLEEKYHACLAFAGLSSEAAEMSAKLIWDLEKEKSLDELVQTLTPGTPRDPIK
jgi:2-methylcitrate dehydratase PrpD